MKGGKNLKQTNSIYLSFVDTKSPCHLVDEPGPCRGLVPRYFFDSKVNECKRFSYGGCFGNANNFRTLKECKSRCQRMYIFILLSDFFSVCSSRFITVQWKGYIYFHQHWILQSDWSVDVDAFSIRGDPIVIQSWQENYRFIFMCLFEYVTVSIVTAHIQRLLYIIYRKADNKWIFKNLLLFIKEKG